jgi:N-acetylglucosaminyl-diphospho-decaprenol L-rhamnosyltransferase
VSATVIVPSYDGRERLVRLLDSLDLDRAGFQVLVVDNGSTDGTTRVVRSMYPAVDVIRLEENVGFSRAINLAAGKADGDALVLVNNDCICDPGFVDALVAPLDPRSGAVMAAGVLREKGDPTVIDSAGMELDPTLLVFDYLNGLPISIVDEGVSDPIGPSAAAAAFDRHAFVEAGGFDEGLFAYWEDVDLVLRLRTLGGRCVLARDARGTHTHSATLRPGSAMKNYLTGFGRGYVLGKFRVLGPRRVLRVLARDLAICLGQAVYDGTVAGVRGRVAGYRVARAGESLRYPEIPASEGLASPVVTTMVRRVRRRMRLRHAGRAAA